MKQPNFLCDRLAVHFLTFLCSYKITTEVEIHFLDSKDKFLVHTPLMSQKMITTLLICVAFFFGLGDLEMIAALSPDFNHELTSDHQL